MNTKTGYVTILGLPNAGKSTLLNALLGQKLSITTNKPQTTRKRLIGILSDENYQIIFLDTPGILKPAYLLQEKMMDSVVQSIKDADVLILILDVALDPGGEKTLKDAFIYDLLSKSKKPKILLLNKIDLSSQEQVNELIEKVGKTNYFKRIIPISSKLAYNVHTVISEIIENLPEGPKYYPDENISDENERFFVSEIIREKIFEHYKDEIPYSCEVVIVDFKEREGRKDFIQAEIIVERDSQKGILIGKQGTALKRIGEESRASIEEFLQRPVYLDLHVKVRSKWRTDENMLKSFGYPGEKE
ncbi:MAG: GTPase Era [Ignavibacteriaceae bacterium]